MNTLVKLDISELEKITGGASDLAYDFGYWIGSIFAPPATHISAGGYTHGGGGGRH